MKVFVQEYQLLIREKMPLNIKSISSYYKNVFNIKGREAIYLATLTKGHTFAYQVLGYLLWENKKTLSVYLDRLLKRGIIESITYKSSA